MSDTSSVSSERAAADGGSDALQTLIADIAKAGREGVERLRAAKTLDELESLRVEYLGKQGQLSALNRRFGTISGEEKPIAGKNLNSHKAQIIQAEKKRREELERAEINKRLETESVDVTLPGARPPRGHLHPVTQTRRQIEDIFRSMGFRVTQSPEVENEWVNFDALNFQPNHPARDMQDTFFTDRGRVLRTHTSGNQIRTMSALEPPMAIISSGKVYRCDSDVTHSPMFFQMEGYLVDEGISMAHLKGTLQEFLTGLFGTDTKVRFRPSFFPFTEPSAEVDVQCDWLSGGWMEILGCGMIHPNVLENCGIDPQKYSGFAFGLGLDRIAMLKYGINNIRLLYENDARFLSQF